MQNCLYKRGLVLTSIIIFIGAGIIPGISGNVQPLSNIEDVNDVSQSPLPRWREGGTPYNPEQSLHPYVIHARDIPTSGYIESPPEYEPVRGVIFCYMTGGWPTVVRDLVVALTQDDEYDEIAYVLVTDTFQMNSAISQFTSGGADMSKVEFIIEPANAIWIRDYGPHFIWQNNALGIVDSHYYHSRPLDNFIPTLIGDDHFIMPTYDMGLYYSGGNFLPGPDRTGFVSSLINIDNPPYQGFDEDYIAELYQKYQGIDDLHIMPQLPFSVDGTGHIDMWMYIVDEDTVIISQFKPGSNPTAIQITNNAVPYMEDLGFEVYRTPAWNANHPDNGYATHWTYTNAFRVNNRLFVPTYGETYPDYADEDAQALAAFTAAAGPDVEIVQINCYPIIWAAGAIHCIVMQVPRYVEPEPAAHVIWPDGGEFLVSGTIQTIEWVASDTDNAEIPQIELYYSIDGGDTYEFIDTTTDTGFYDWEVPHVYTEQAKVKVVAVSSDSDQGEAESTEVFQITPTEQFVYDFSTGAGVDKFCYGHQTNSWYNIDGERKPVTTELGSSNYPKMAYSDATGGDSDSNRYISPVPSGGAESTHIFEFTINEDPDDIRDIEILWEGYADGCTQIELYVWDYFKDQWSDGEGLYNQNRYMDNWAGNRDGYLKNHIHSNFEDFINPNGQMTLLLYAERLVFDDVSDRSFHDYISITVSKDNDPPNAPEILGETNGKPGKTYSYDFKSTDPNGDQVSYYINWGDGDTTDWTSFQDSGTSYLEDHVWANVGKYTIEAKAKDTYGAESDWESLEVDIKKGKAINKPFLKLLQSHSNLFQILRQILQLLGLQ
jgi:agmatine/peptidylarginine deiminase